MGECGCGATSLDYKFAGPEGITYGIEIYSGCYYCDTPAGVVLHRYTQEDDWSEAILEHVPEAPFLGWQGATEGWGEVALPVISREGLVASINQNLQDYGIELRPNASVFRLVEDAVYETAKAATPHTEPEEPTDA